MPNRIAPNDNGRTVIAKLAAGNSGAAVVLGQWFAHCTEIDPDAYTEQAFAFVHMLTLDDYDIVGPRLWVFYKDVCGSDIRRVLGMMRAQQFGFITSDDLVAAIDGSRGVGMSGKTLSAADVDALLAKVEHRLPRFKRAEPAAVADA